MLGKGITIDYDRIQRAVARATGSGGGWKPIPKGSSVSIVIPTGTSVGEEFNASAEPDDGYEMVISYIILSVPDGVEANVLVETSEGEFPLLANNVTTGVQLDASDFLGLGGIKRLTLYAKVNAVPTSDITVSMEFGGRQIKVEG